MLNALFGKMNVMREEDKARKAQEKKSEVDYQVKTMLEAVAKKIVENYNHDWFDIKFKCHIEAYVKVMMILAPYGIELPSEGEFRLLEYANKGAGNTVGVELNGIEEVPDPSSLDPDVRCIVQALKEKYELIKKEISENSNQFALLREKIDLAMTANISAKKWSVEVIDFSIAVIKEFIKQAYDSAEFKSGGYQMTNESYGESSKLVIQFKP